MSLTPGQRLVNYEVVSSLGAGGMGEVYRARDTKLNRDVAIKVLPEAFASDPERLSRFTREAQTLASLNHPNIAAIYGIEETPPTTGSGSGIRALVMELVEGEDLSTQIARGPIPIAEALPIARQIAEALETAHEHGIIHRDLKPANIKVRADGTVKVLDFGLAKAMDSSGATNPDVSHSPTLTGHGTQMGLIIGTAAYMSPEQAKGRTVDRRADIWAFGVVLYEMISGRRAFKGEDVSDTLASVLKDTLSLDALPAETPPRLKRLIGRCLDRDLKTRLRDIGEARVKIARIEAGGPDSGPSAPTTAAAAVPAWRHVLPWVIATISTLAALGLWLTARAVPPPAPTVRFDLKWPGDAASNAGPDSDYFDLSPDGRYLVIVAEGRLWVRALDSVQNRAVPGSEGATYPFWSPDGSSIGFFAGGELRRIARDGGVAQKLCEAPSGRGGTWGPDGTIVFSGRGGAEGLSRVEDRGGLPKPLPRVSAGRADHRYPQFLPDGRHFLFTYLSASKEAAGIYVGDLDGTPPIRVLDGSDSAQFAPTTTPAESGHILFRRQEVLMAQSFDARSLKASGEIFPVAERVGMSGNTGHGAFAVSASGVLALSELSRERQVLTWIDRSGGRIGTATGRLDLRGFAMSPDARTLAYSHRGGDNADRMDVWSQALDGGSPSRFTFEGSNLVGWAFPLWSPDGSRLVYATQDNSGEAKYEVRRRRFDRTGPEETLAAVETGALYPWDLSPDGRQLAYTNVGSGLWLLPLESGAKPMALARTPPSKSCAQFSPDGRFIAYASGDAGASQVFVQPVPPTGALWQVSTKGGDMPRWRGDGREILYRTPDGRLMAAPVRPNPGSFDFGTPQPLFGGIPSSGNVLYFTYQPARDGQRFLVSLWDAQSRSPITVVLNWQQDIRR